MKARIVSIGDEILLGQITDTNSTFIARQLSEIGIEVHEIRSIRDDRYAIIGLLNDWTKNSDIIISTGGLGPTKDDVTKKSLADFLQTELVLDVKVLQQVEKRLQQMQLKMNPLNRDQALVPKGSMVIPNRLGTAPGIWTEQFNCLIINLAGVPFEMKALMKEEIIPRLKKKFSLPCIAHRFLSVSNCPESELALILEDWENHLPENMHLAYLPESGRIKLRITAYGEDQKVLDRCIQHEIDKIIPLLDMHLDSQDTAEVGAVLGRLLVQEKLTLGTAESCTGGYIAHLLTSVSGSSAYFKGGVVAYATSIKSTILKVSPTSIDQFTVVSEKVAMEMAEGVRHELKTDIGLSTTGVAGPKKGEDGRAVGTLWVGISTQERTWARSYDLSYLDREDFIVQASKLALQLTFQILSKK
ncbi:MAG TPA: CinA family nicotinamide mononucleotide deamidase-related protein [Moheibacter sp.]|nr:CinA family nicotinamide mononucleotide deamidase-related protein [Moheibacter sp.]